MGVASNLGRIWPTIWDEHFAKEILLSLRMIYGQCGLYFDRRKVKKLYDTVAMQWCILVFVLCYIQLLFYPNHSVPSMLSFVLGKLILKVRTSSVLFLKVSNFDLSFNGFNFISFYILNFKGSIYMLPIEFEIFVLSSPSVYCCMLWKLFQFNF